MAENPQKQTHEERVIEAITRIDRLRVKGLKSLGIEVAHPKSREEIVRQAKAVIEEKRLWALKHGWA